MDKDGEKHQDFRMIHDDPPQKHVFFFEQKNDEHDAKNQQKKGFHQNASDFTAKKNGFDQHR